MLRLQLHVTPEKRLGKINRHKSLARVMSRKGAVTRVPQGRMKTLLLSYCHRAVSNWTGAVCERSSQPIK